MHIKLFILILLFFTSLIARDIQSDSKIQGRLNIINGASAECVMHQFYANSGWLQIEGEIGRNGIDGLYYKKDNNTIKEVLVAESKWNTSQLGISGKNRAVKQMSQEWVLRTMDKLIKNDPSMPYGILKRFIENNQYRARLFRLKPISNNRIQITLYKIKNKGLRTFDEVKDTQLKPIDINRPKNTFEIEMVQAYNKCRRQYLHNYFSALDDNEINGLLKDNYIQKMDIKSILR